MSVAVLLGAPRERAEKELKESLLFEIELAHASQVTPMTDRRTNWLIETVNPLSRQCS